jgi:hypothetical protein
MGVFTAIAVAVKAIVAKVTFAAVAKFVGTILVSQLVGRVLAKRAGQGAGGGDGGGRVQLPPATNNKIPVVYGNAFLGGPIIDAYLTPDQKTMYYVVALAEVTDNGTISYGDIYYDGKLVTFGSDGFGGTTQVTQLKTNNASPSSPSVQIDTKINGYLNIYLYNNGSTGGTNTSQNAYDVMPSWAGDPNYAMTNCAFAILKVKYNTDAGTTSLGALTAQVINTESGQSTGVYRPGTALRDYMTNDRYGCAIPLAQVDTVSLTTLNTYSDQLITYVPVGGGSATQARYRVNGPLDTGVNCLDNLQILVDSCDSWLQYSELTGKWKVVINRAYTGTINDLFLINSSNLVGGININPIDLNETYNEVEVAYPNKNIKDQTDFQVLDLATIAPSVMSPNEAINRLNITLQVVNEAVQAKYLALRRLLQSREDITISLQTDFSGIQVEAGDVIRVDHETYGWTNKLFRVLTVAEQTYDDNTVGAQIVAFEYNGTIYDDNSIQNFVPSFNTGLKDPNVIDIPIAPTVANGTNANSGTTYFTVTGTVPANGAVTYFDFNYGNSTNVANHILYRTAQNGVGEAFVNSSNVEIPINDLPAGNYYFSVTARNDFAGRQSPASTVFNWAGPQVTQYDSNSNTGGIGGNNIRPGSITANVFAPGTVFIDVVNTLPNTCNANTIGTQVYLTTDGRLYTCNGNAFVAVASNTLIDGQIISTQIANVANSAIIGQIIEAQIANAAITSDKIAANAVIADKIFANAITANKIAAGAVESDKILANAVVAGKIAALAVTAGTIAANAIEANNIQANAITSSKILAGAVTAGKIDVTNLQAISANLGTVTSGTLRTSSSNTANRVEISSDGNFPIWYGNNTKDAANAKFYLDTSGNGYFAGTLGAAGGTISIDTGAISNAGVAGILKGAQFVLCRDGDNVVFNPPYPAGTDARVAVIFVGGGLTYSNDPNLNPPLFQKFEAFNITANGFTASLKLSEAFATGNLTSTSDSFGGNTTVTKVLADEAYDDTYTATYDITGEANQYFSEYYDFFGWITYYMGWTDVYLHADNGVSNNVIAGPITQYFYSGVPGNVTIIDQSIFGVADGMVANTTFTLVANGGSGGNVVISGNTLSYTYSNATANVISATPNGVPAVTALVYLQ